MLPLIGHANVRDKKVVLFLSFFFSLQSGALRIGKKSF